ncbi:MAG: hypothetical protein KJZ70_08415 [Bryobacterales bacterium]|nr:hypothetical protein [Bryobacterales bacterium]
MWTRRDISGRILAGLAASLWPVRRSRGSEARPLSIELLLDRFSAPLVDIQSCYRADITIQIFRIPLYRKRGVGGAVANLRQYQGGRESAIGISFLAGSNPEKAGGVNRFGYIEEVVLEESSVPAEAAYFGMMTSSPESSFESARSALGEANRKQAYYAGIDGSLKASRSVSTAAAFAASGQYTWFGHPPLTSLMKRALLDESSKVTKESRTNPRWSVPVTFLYAVSEAMRQPENKRRARYIYHGREFELETSREPDAKKGAVFQESGLVKNWASVLRLEGRSKQIATGETTSFTIWQDSVDTNALPLRFEFQPKSFLKLTFERDPHVKPPSLT